MSVQAHEKKYVYFPFKFFCKYICLLNAGIFGPIKYLFDWDQMPEVFILT